MSVSQLALKIVNFAYVSLAFPERFPTPLCRSCSFLIVPEGEHQVWSNHVKPLKCKHIYILRRRLLIPQ